MANVIRTQFQGKDGRLNIDKGILTLYGGSAPIKWDIRNREVVPLLREFLNTAYAQNKAPTKTVLHRTNKNSFAWGTDSNLGVAVLERWDLTSGILKTLHPNTEHTKDILSAMVRANVK